MFVLPIREAAEKLLEMDDDQIAERKKNAWNRANEVDPILSSLSLHVSREYVTLKLSRALKEAQTKRQEDAVKRITKGLTGKVRVSSSKSRKRCLEAFEDLEPVGMGQFGEVYAGTKKKIRYAIKRIKVPTDQADPKEDLKEDMKEVTDTTISMIRSEIEIARLMSEKGIGPKVHDIFVCNDAVYIVMDLYDRTLAEHIQKFGLREKDVKEVFDLIEKMHDEGVLHNDLHIGNVMVRNDGKKVISDFGLAFKSDNPVTPKRLDRAYMARTMVGYASDQFADLVADMFATGEIKVSYEAKKPDRGGRSKKAFRSPRAS